MGRRHVDKNHSNMEMLRLAAGRCIGRAALRAERAAAARTLAEGAPPLREVDPRPRLDQAAFQW